MAGPRHDSGKVHPRGGPPILGMPTRALLILVVLLALPAAHAWSGDPETPHHADLAAHLLGALDEEQARDLREHLAEFRQGSLDADVELAPQYHRYNPETQNGSALRYLDRAVPALRENLTARAMTAEDARQVGIVVHVLFDLTQPLHTGNGTIDAPHHAEYETAAYSRAALPPITRRATDSEGNVSEIAASIARESARQAAQLEALLRADGPWNDEIGLLTNATLREGTPRVADALALILPAPPAAPPTPSVTPPTQDEQEEGTVATPTSPTIAATPTQAGGPPDESALRAREIPSPAYVAIAAILIPLLKNEGKKLRGGEAKPTRKAQR